MCAAFARSSPAQVLNYDITVPAPVGASNYQLWVDANSTLAGMQRCRAFKPSGNVVCIPPIGPPFTCDLAADVWLYNPTPGKQTIGVHFVVNFDPTKLAFVGVQKPALFGLDNFPSYVSVGSGRVKVVTSVDPCSNPPGGGIVAQICFTALADGQSGIDINDQKVYIKEVPCNPFLVGSDITQAKAQVILDSIGNLGCWTVNANEDKADIAPGDGISDSDPALGIIKSTLRACIQEANARIGEDGIEFSIEQPNLTIQIPGVGLGALPSLTDNAGVFIDGETQPGVVVDGNYLFGSGNGFEVTSSYNTIRALSVVRFNNSGIKISGGSAKFNNVKKCMIGTDWGDHLNMGNKEHGVRIENAALKNEIGASSQFDTCNLSSSQDEDGNVIVENLGAGVAILNDLNENSVTGNYVGVTRNDKRMGNHGAGVLIHNSWSNKVFANVIGDNGVSGIFIIGTSRENRVGCNYIGVSRQRLLISNRGDGVTVFGDMLGVPEQNFIGYISPLSNRALTNHIQYNTNNGVSILNRAVFNSILTNEINANSGNGIWLETQPGPIGFIVESNKIGGPGLEGNGIGNNFNGIVVTGPGSKNNTIRRNVVFKNKQCGVLLRDGAASNQIGDPMDSKNGNSIFGNTSEGIAITHAGTDMNVITQNSITLNGALGIDLNADGVTANDLLDSDAGSNNEQNYPELISAKARAGVLEVRGNLKSKPNDNWPNGDHYRIEFFSAQNCDPSGFGEGNRYLGSTIIDMGTHGIMPFEHKLFVHVAIGDFVTTTATRLDANLKLIETSEFSKCVQVTVP